MLKKLDNISKLLPPNWSLVISIESDRHHVELFNGACEIKFTRESYDLIGGVDGAIKYLQKINERD